MGFFVCRGEPGVRVAAAADDLAAPSGFEMLMEGKPFPVCFDGVASAALLAAVPVALERLPCGVLSFVLSPVGSGDVSVVDSLSLSFPLFFEFLDGFWPMSGVERACETGCGE